MSLFGVQFPCKMGWTFEAGSGFGANTPYLQSCGVEGTTFGDNCDHGPGLAGTGVIHCYTKLYSLHLLLDDYKLLEFSDFLWSVAAQRSEVGKGPDKHLQYYCCWLETF